MPTLSCSEISTVIDSYPRKDSTNEEELFFTGKEKVPSDELIVAPLFPEKDLMETPARGREEDASSTMPDTTRSWASRLYVNEMMARKAPSILGNEFFFMIHCFTIDTPTRGILTIKSF